MIHRPNPDPEDAAEDAFAHAVYALCREAGYAELAILGNVTATELVCWSRRQRIPEAWGRLTFLRRVCPPS